MKAKIFTTLLSLTIYFCTVAAQEAAPINAKDSVVVLIRCDDIGMCHAVNMAVQQLAESKIPFSASVMFACPWYDEAVEILKTHPEISIGVHLTLNAEWKNYRWGPVSGRTAVPSLVDSDGYFFPSRALLFAHHPTVSDVETELRAQVERAVHSGLHIDYLDYHMSTAVSTPEFRAVVEKLAHEYGLGISRYFGEEDAEGWYAVSPEQKKDTLVAVTSNLQPGAIRLMVFHIGLETPEMNALVDLNPFGPRNMSQHRHAELEALLSPEFRAALASKHARLITYRQLVETVGVGAMKRPRE